MLLNAFEKSFGLLKLFWPANSRGTLQQRILPLFHGLNGGLRALGHPDTPPALTSRCSKYLSMH